MYVFMYACMYVRMYVCTYIYIPIGSMPLDAPKVWKGAIEFLSQRAAVAVFGDMTTEVLNVISLLLCAVVCLFLLYFVFTKYKYTHTHTHNTHTHTHTHTHTYTHAHKQVLNIMSLHPAAQEVAGKSTIVCIDDLKPDKRGKMAESYALAPRQKRPTNTQKRPTNTQKRPTNTQKRPANTQKRPTNTQNG